MMQIRRKNEGAHHAACAACKHQRKKCGDNCALAPYFPANKNQEFQAVHRVFGVSNIIKLVKRVRKENRKLLVESLIWEAKCRLDDPVLGSYAYKMMYYDLLQKIDRNNGHHNHHQMLQSPVPHPHNHLHQEDDLKSFQNNDHLVVNGESSSVEHAWGFNPQNKNHNMSVESAFYGSDYSSSQIANLNSYQHQHHLPNYYYSGQQFN